ncbi:DUF2271 domain-containing protein [uncultured Thioclava sp.]|uniref:DUF2271 domain-containing protein n=1 Tax=uncultured Thioclava sp. TaxID=473858 RepID=UPI0025EA0A42|nr:DUF2271 domain-containing protein [uncultured Thioclava sp.]
MKTLMTTLALTTALTVPGLASARPVTFSTQMTNYYGNNAYFAMYVTNANGAYVGSLWMAGGNARYYRHLSGWYQATGGDAAQVSGITGASVGSGRSVKVTLDLQDALFDAGYVLHVDAAVENMPESPKEIVVPLSKANLGKAIGGRRYIKSLTITE